MPPVNTVDCPTCGNRLFATVTGDRADGNYYCDLCDRSFSPIAKRRSTLISRSNDDLVSIGSQVGHRSISPPAGYAAATTDWLATQPRDTARGAAYRVVHRAELISNPLPRTPDGRVHSNFLNRRRCVAPASFVVRLKRARVWGPEGAIITSDNVLLGDLSNRPWTRTVPQHPIFSQQRISTPDEFSGTLGVVVARGGWRNYGHWMFDVLPRIELLRQSGFYRSVDAVLVNAVDTGFQHDTLEALGVTAKRIITFRERPHIRAETLVATSLPRSNNVIPRWVISFLRKSFLTKHSTAGSSRRRRIYVSRQDSEWRQVVNEAHVIRELDRRGFECIRGLGSMALVDHVSLFNEADVIVCAHGAGMVNTVFCRSGARVIELIPQDWPDPLHWAFSGINRTVYGYVLCPSPPGSDAQPRMERDICVPIDALSTLLNTMDC